MSEILQKGEALRKKFTGGDPGSVHEVERWFEEATRLLANESLREVAGIAFLIEKFTSFRDSANQRLMSDTSDKLPEYDRDLLINVRNLADLFLSIFDNNKAALDRLEKRIDDELK